MTPDLPVFQRKHIWILCDEQPAAALLRMHCDVYTVIAASPDIKRNLKLRQASGLESYYLDIWKWRKLYAARSLRLKDKREMAATMNLLHTDVAYIGGG